MGVEVIYRHVEVREKSGDKENFLPEAKVPKYG